MRAAAIARSAPASSVLAIVCAVGSVYAALAMPSEPSANNVALVASNTLLMNWYLWTMVTGHLVDASIIKALIFVPAVFLLSAKLEHSIGIRGIATYLVTTCTLVSLMIIVLLLCELPVSIYHFYNSTFFGQAGLLIALLVGNVRVNVEDRLGSLRVKSRLFVFPAIAVYGGLALLDERINGDSKWIHDATFTAFAFPVSFVLLKLFDFSNHESDAIFPSREAYSDDPFTLDAFFPAVVRPFVRTISILLENFAVRFCKCYKRPSPRTGFAEAQLRTSSQLFADDYDLESWGATRPNNASPTGRLGARKIKNPIAERRRLRALKALDQKLAQISREPEISFDDSDDEDEQVHTESNGDAAASAIAKSDEELEKDSPEAGVLVDAEPTDPNSELGDTNGQDVQVAKTIDV